MSCLFLTIYLIEFAVELVEKKLTLDLKLYLIYLCFTFINLSLIIYLQVSVSWLSVVSLSSVFATSRLSEVTLIAGVKVTDMTLDKPVTSVVQPVRP